MKAKAQEPEEADEEAEEEADEEEADEEEADEERRPRPSRREGESLFVEERVYTIPLQRAWIVPPKKRAPKALRLIRSFIQRHMKVGKKTIETEEGEEGTRIIISNEVNERVWSRGIEKPPRKLRVKAAVDEEGNVTILLA